MRGPVVLEPVGEFSIPVDKDLWKQWHLSANQRPHPQVRANKTRWWRQLAKAMCLNAGLSPLDKVRIEVWYRFPDNRRREVANLQPTSKAIVDGIVDSGVIPDDRDEVCVGPDNRRLWPNGSHEVRVRIFSVV